METLWTNAVLLLLIGMVTVFVILFLVTISGSILIKALNRLEEYNNPPTKKSGVSHKVIAIATAVVHEITEGQGKIEKIEKK
jgi:oxaloacetate decarboxylase gamma subunit